MLTIGDMVRFKEDVFNLYLSTMPVTMSILCCPMSDHFLVAAVVPDLYEGRYSLTAAEPAARLINPLTLHGPSRFYVPMYDLALV